MSIENNIQESKTTPEIISFFRDTFGDEPFFFENFLELDEEKKSRLAKLFNKEIVLENKKSIQSQMDFLRRKNEDKLKKCSFALNGFNFIAYSVNPNFSPVVELVNLKKIALERFNPQRKESADTIYSTELDYYNTLVEKVKRRINQEEPFPLGFFPTYENAEKRAKLISKLLTHGYLSSEPSKGKLEDRNFKLLKIG